MKQLSMQNLPDDFYPAKETLKVEVGSKTIVQNPSSHNSNPFSEQMTIVQGASPFSEVEVAGKTILQNPNSQNPTPSVALADDVSLPQRPRVAQQISSSSQPSQRVEAIHKRDPLARFSLEDDSKNLHAAEVTVVQNHNNPIVHHSDSVVQHTQQTIVQYSDSAIHSSGEQTVCQAIPSSSTNRGQTLIQSKMPKSSHPSTLTTMQKNREHIPLSYSSIQNMFWRLGSFPSRITSTIKRFFYSMRDIDLRQLQSLFKRDRQPARGNILEQSSSTSLNYDTHNAIASGEQPSLEQYQKKQRELDLCRLCFAKELARNGKFRSAIFEAEQISETSYLFKDAQMLIQSWR